MPSRLLRRLALGLAAVVLLPVLLVALVLGGHWLGEVPDARAVNAELDRAVGALSGVEVVRRYRAEPRAFTCCGDGGLSASAYLTSPDDPAATAARVAAGLRAAGWEVQGEGRVREDGGWLRAVRGPAGPSVDVSVFRVTDGAQRGFAAGSTEVAVTAR